MNEFTGLPFWSADSRSIVFPGRGRFLRVLLPEGPPEEFLPTPVPNRGGTWSETGRVMFTANGLFTVGASGGQPAPVELPQAYGARDTRPQFLPGTDLFFLFLRLASDGEENEVILARLQGQKGWT